MTMKVTCLGPEKGLNTITGGELKNKSSDS